MRYLLSLSLVLSLLFSLLLSLPASATEVVWPDLSTPPSASAGDGSKDAALVIGIQQYARVEPVLGARSNANDWYRWLVKTRRVPLSRVHRLTDGQAVDYKIRSELSSAVSEVQPGGTLWVVFIGHGAPSKDGRDGLLVGADADRSADGIYQRSVTRSEVLAAIESGPRAHAVVVLDACFSGQGQTGAVLVDGLQSLVPTSARVASNTVTVLTGAGSGEFAGRLSGTARPAFSYLVLGALRGWGDDNGDGQVTAGEVLSYATGALRATVRDRTQTPSLTGPDIPLGSGRERGPDLVELALVEPEPILHEEAVDFASLTAQAKATDAAARLAAQAKAAARAAMEKERRRQLDEAAGSVRASASRDYAAISSLVSSPSESGRAVLEAYVARYGGAKVTVAGVSEPVVVPEISKVQAVLSALDGASAQGSGGYEMVRIPAGSFVMGSPSAEQDRDDDETQHPVRISRSFMMGRTEVSQGLWEDVMGSNPSRTGRRVWDSDGDGQADDHGVCKEYGGVSLVGDDLPVMCVSWCDGVVFANTLSSRAGLTEAYQLPGGFTAGMSYAQCKSKASAVRRNSGANGYRLPTEAEWEYAGRAGEHALFAGAESYESVCGVGNVADLDAKHEFGESWNVAPCKDAHAGLAPVASYTANAWGLYDMTGNVWEWTWDYYGPYPSGSVTDPTGASTAADRVLRGGSWFISAADARLSDRRRFDPGFRSYDLGFRFARSLP